MPRPRQNMGTAFGTNRNKDKTRNKSPEFEFDARTVNDELMIFEHKHRLPTADFLPPNERRQAYKYPNIELKRCFEPKKFRQSNHDIHRALVMST